MQDKINILIELKEAGATILTTTDNRNYFSVPADYFNNLTDDILTHVFIKSLPAENPYHVPSGYFENFSGVLLEKLHVEKNIGPTEKTVYTVPEGYFNSLADNILKKIQSSASHSVRQELEELSPLLSSISKANVYSVPENYFEQLQPINKEQQNISPAAKVISLGSRTKRWLSYAAAACVAAFLFGGGYLYFSAKPANQTTQTQPPLASADVQKEISSLSDEEINNYLKDNNSIAVYTNTNEVDQQQNIDIESLLQNVSDEEIQQYLSQDPESSQSGGGI